MNGEWYTAMIPVQGKRRACQWCTSDEPDYEPSDDSDAQQALCRGHYAEWSGESLAGLDRRDAAEYADMSALGYFD